MNRQQLNNLLEADLQENIPFLDDIAAGVHKAKKAYKTGKMSKDVSAAAKAAEHGLPMPDKMHYRTPKQAKKAFAGRAKRIGTKSKRAVKRGVDDAAKKVAETKTFVSAKVNQAKDAVKGPVKLGKVLGGVALGGLALHGIGKGVKYFRKSAAPVVKAAKVVTGAAPKLSQAHKRMLGVAGVAGGLTYLARRRRKDKNR